MSECFNIKEEVLIGIENEITENNIKLLEKLKEKDSILDSIEFIKIHFSNNVLEDIKFLNSLSGNEFFQVRYANILMRDLLEQVIEFIYITKNPNIISDYIGHNIKDTSFKSQQNLVKALLKFGEKRFKGGRKSVSQMCIDINQKKSDDEKLSLYDIYQILSDECHNSYFQSMLDNIGEIELGEKVYALTDDQVTYLMIIINQFLIAYR